MTTKHGLGRAGHCLRVIVTITRFPDRRIPVGYAVAEVVDAPLLPFVVRKLGVPGHEELAMGAIGSGGFFRRHLGDRGLAAATAE